MMIEELEVEFAKMEVPPFVTENIDMLKKSIVLEVRLIDDLLDMTKVLHGKIHLHKNVADLHDLIESTTKLLSYEVKGKRIKVVQQLTAQRHHANCDSARVQQVLWNLVKNAGMKHGIYETYTL